MRIKFVLNDAAINSKYLTLFKSYVEDSLGTPLVEPMAHLLKSIFKFDPAKDKINEVVENVVIGGKFKDFDYLNVTAAEDFRTVLNEINKNVTNEDMKKINSEVYAKTDVFFEYASTIGELQLSKLNFKALLASYRDTYQELSDARGDFDKIRKIVSDKFHYTDKEEIPVYNRIYTQSKAILKVLDEKFTDLKGLSAVFEKENDIYEDLKTKINEVMNFYKTKNPKLKLSRRTVLAEIETEMKSIESAFDDIDNIENYIKSYPTGEDEIKFLRKYIGKYRDDLRVVRDGRTDLHKDENKDDLKVIQGYIDKLDEWHKTLAPIKKETTKSYDEFIKRIPTVKAALKNAMNDKEKAVDILTKAGIPTPLKDDPIELLKSVVQDWNNKVGKFLPEAKSEDDIKSINELDFELKSYYNELEAKSKEKRLLDGPLKDLKEYSDFGIQLKVLMYDIISERKRLAEEAVRNNFIVKSLGNLTPNRTKNALAELSPLSENQEEDPETAEKVDAILKKYLIKVKEPFLTVKELISNLKKLKLPENKWVAKTSKWFNENKLAFNDEIESFQALVKKLESIVGSLEKMSSDGNYESLSPDNKSSVESLTNYYKLSLKFIKDYLSALEKQLNITSEVVSLVGAGLNKASKASGKAVNVTLDATKKVMTKKIGIDK